MDSATYQSMSLRTVPAELQFWDIEFSGDVEDARTKLLTNCALGMAGEAAEISELTISDEIGDGYWYAYICLWILNVESYAPQTGVADAQSEAYRAAGQVCEYVKKHVFHGRAFDEVLPILTRFTKRYVDALASLDSQTATETFEQNLAKLKARYPAGFFERG